MYYIKIHYGLGNQLFQYALARRLSIENQIPFKLDLSYFESENTPREYLLNKFNIQEQIATSDELNPFHQQSFINRQLSKLNHSIVPVAFSNFFREKDDAYDPLVYKCSANTYLMGYWQDERYFKPIEKILRYEFTFKHKPSDQKNIDTLKKITSVNAIAVHIRRTDYITDVTHHEKVGICSLDYYKKALATVSERMDNPFFFVFSDDIAWVKEHLIIEAEHTYVDHNSIMNGYEDLRLMMACKHHIIANSSFSWWGAWLSNYPEKLVIAPKIWQNENNDKRTLPEAWIRI